MNKDALVNSIETAGNRSKQMSGILSRYTTWQRFYYWLKNNKIAFGNYKHWEDKSDVAILDAYAKHINKQIRVICFMKNSTDYQDCHHHWKNYANGDDGIRVVFLENFNPRNFNRNAVFFCILGVAKNHPFLKHEAAENRIE